MIAGETVWVSVPALTGIDDFGNEVWEHGKEDPGTITWGDLLSGTWGGGSVPSRHRSDSVQVDNVLVNPSTTTYDRVEPGRPHGMECDLTLYFPREFDMDVRNAVVTVRGEDYRVVGDPERYTDAALPLGCLWNLVVRVARFDA